MALTKIKIGSFVKIYNENCNIPDLTPNKVSGINRDKMFFEPSRQVGGDTSKYKIVPPNYFACNLMHVGRDAVLPIALNNTDCNKIVSPAYTIFYISNENLVYKEYFYILLNSDEKDRYFWFNADSSVRDGMSWEDFCNLELNVPSLPIQQKYVKVYKAMLANQKAYERGLEDLKLAYESLINEYKHKSPKKNVSSIFEEIDCRNNGAAIKDVQGINIQKQFMPTVANTVNVDLSKYKVVKKGQFAFSGMQTGRDECIRIALHNNDNPIIISPAYTVLRTKEKNILPEYIMMWFSRKEIDRLGWFMSDASIRANLEMDRFYEIKIPIPDIKIQKSIVEIYKVYQTRKEINEKLKAQLKNICPILIKGSTEEAR